MTTEVTTTEQNINLPAQTSELIDKVHSMEFSQLLQQYLIPYGTKLLLAIAIYVIGKSIARLL
ncbi:mechanosensitive ion channel family protein, partial [Avibacterium paragallinarum]